MNIFYGYTTFSNEHASSEFGDSELEHQHSIASGVRFVLITNTPHH
jgi:hypothetical protein